ncbi:MAG TPA: hypothetical protein VHW23_34105 [Kofleriaceae bacterium]|nr:hypothetical protein [Kofleriaceae bacterium]
MRVRRIAAQVTTVLVAILVALAVPVSQLRTVWIAKVCCCPDPDHCHCPDVGQKADPSSEPSMRPCHNTQQVMVAPQLPAFRAPAVAVAIAVTSVTGAAEHSIPAPHPAPPPVRPDAPS